MPLVLGTRLGPYEIVALLGAGGMGEVYRARDTRLDRTVAVKILPAALATDPQFRERFDREARAISQLTHPHICTLYDVGEQEGTAFLVMELLEGETLEARLVNGALPLDAALAFAIQILRALDAAHRAGIVHRDLKPGNIFLVRSGGASAPSIAKLLDFGLAKTNAPVVAVSGTMVPTTPPNVTAQGTILGTFQYMAPEQIEGIDADARTDIFAFGCVLFETVTGTKAFDGKTRASLIGAILKDEPPPVSQVQPAVPAGLNHIVATCLAKDPDDRWQTARDLLRELKWVAEGGVSSAAPTTDSRLVTRSSTLPWAVAGAAVILACVLLMLWAPWRAAAPPRVTRTTITTSGPAALTITGVDRDLALSPDGTHVVYVGNNGTQLFVRALDTLEPVAIATGGDVRGPFVSPDGQWVGFVDGTTLRKVALTGGAPITLTSVDGIPRGATWAPDDTIIFATNNPATGLQRVSAAGGMPEVLTRPDRAQGEADSFWPEILPGGRAVLFTITSQTGGLDAAQIAVRDLRTGTQRILVRGGSHGRYLASGPGSPKRAEREGGHLVYVAAGTLRAIPFDPTRLETHGTAIPVLPRLATTSFGAGDFAVAAGGTLVYVDAPGSLAANARTLVWVDRTGNEEPVAASPRAYVHPRLSPDGTRIALASTDQENDIWIWDLRRATLTRLTLDPGEDSYPVWTPDGKRIVFSSNRDGGQNNLWWQAADGTGTAERLTTSSNTQLVTGITPDGTAVVFYELPPKMGRDLLKVALDGTHRVTPLLQTKFDELNGIVSPDGRWLAYESNSSGSFEIYVQPFPNVGGGQRQVSTAGGRQPLWARSGKELFYVGSDAALLSAPVEASGTTWNNGTPIKILEGRYVSGGGTLGRTYDVSPDGQRFLKIKAAGTGASAAPPALIVVQHWDEELKRLVPTGRQ